MDVTEKEIFELRKWAIDLLKEERKPAGKEGTATLNREIMRRVESLAIPEEFKGLLARQLRVDGKARNEPRLKIEQLAAAKALARNPDLSSKKLETAFKKLTEDPPNGRERVRRERVSRQTIAQWRNDPSFNELVAIFKIDDVLKEIFPWQKKA